jgi:transcriptional repressor NrdR
MRCPVCSHEETRVVDSRVAGDGFSIRRRRECEECVHRFSTVEEVQLLDVSVVKRDGSTEPYRREKMVRGLNRALEKRTYTPEGFSALVGSIERDIQAEGGDAIASQAIGDIVMRHLRQFDKVAYVRFASVYRSFDDVKTFQDELDKLLVAEASHPRRKK